MENLSLKLVVTAYRKGILTCLLENGTAVQLDYNNGSSVVGSIYAGKVRSVSKNLEAAFVDIGTPLPGYLPLSGERLPRFLDGREHRAVREGDEILVKVRKDGPACHLGTDSCFEYPLMVEEEDFTLDTLYVLLKSRKETLPEGSYTSYLFQKGTDKILKKVGEECTEVIIAAKGGERAETVYEVADLAYHVMVMMVELGIEPEEIRRELASRHVIDHKVKQEKMV